MVFLFIYFSFLGTTNAALPSTFASLNNTLSPFNASPNSSTPDSWSYNSPYSDLGPHLNLLTSTNYPPATNSYSAQNSTYTFLANKTENYLNIHDSNLFRTHHEYLDHESPPLSTVLTNTVNSSSILPTNQSPPMMTTHEIIHNSDKSMYIENRDKMEEYQQVNHEQMNHEGDLHTFDQDKTINSGIQFREDKLVGFRIQKEESPVNWVEKNNYRTVGKDIGTGIKQENGNNGYQQNGPLPPFMN